MKRTYSILLAAALCCTVANGVTLSDSFTGALDFSETTSIDLTNYNKDSSSFFITMTLDFDAVRAYIGDNPTSSAGTVATLFQVTTSATTNNIVGTAVGHDTRSNNGLFVTRTATGSDSTLVSTQCWSMGEVAISRLSEVDLSSYTSAALTFSRNGNTLYAGLTLVNNEGTQTYYSAKRTNITDFAADTT